MHFARHLLSPIASCARHGDGPSRARKRRRQRRKRWCLQKGTREMHLVAEIYRLEPWKGPVACKWIGEQRLLAAEKVVYTAYMRLKCRDWVDVRYRTPYF